MLTTGRRAAAGGVAALVALALTAATGVAAPRAAAATSPACGGTSIAKPTGGTWQCTFSDEFAGSALDASKWVPQVTATSGYTNGQTACFVDAPGNISVADGVLSLTARKEAAPFSCADPHGAFTTQYTSGMVSSWGRFAQAYGRFEVRAKVSRATAAGLQTALWLWPQNATKYGAWPASGEIDIAEMYSQFPDRAIPYVHYNPGFYDANVTNNYCLLDVGSFHNYTVEWTTSSIKISYDGRVCINDYWSPAWPLRKPQPFDQPFIVALTQALGIGSNAFDPARTQLPATTDVDYVRVWR